MVSYVSYKVARVEDVEVLILVVVDNGLVQDIYDNINDYEYVLILIVVDNGLVQFTFTDDTSVSAS